jgi:hypothetical protein
MLYPQGFEPEEIKTGLWKLPPGDFADYHLDLLTKGEMPFGALLYLSRLDWDKKVKSDRKVPIKIVYTFSPENETNLDAHACYISLALRLPDIEWLCLCDNVEIFPKVYPAGQPWPSNVWLGTTVNSQKDATSKLKILSYILAPVRFILITKPSGRLSLRKYLPREKNVGVNWVIETRTPSDTEEYKNETEIYNELNDSIYRMKEPVTVFIRDFAKSDDESVVLLNKRKGDFSPLKQSTPLLLMYDWFYPVHKRKKYPLMMGAFGLPLSPAAQLCYNFLSPGIKLEPWAEEEKEELKKAFRAIAELTGG